MQQLTLISAGTVVWEEAPEPRLSGPASALVRPVAVATCDFDHLLVDRRVPLDLPVPLGHECVAVVTEVGADVTRVRPGQRVVVPYQVSCGRCAPCRAGSTGSCAEVPWLSCYGLGPVAGGWGGALADVVAVPFADAMLVPLPAEVAAEDAAALSCNLPDAYRCVSGIVDRPGERVLVAGGAFHTIGLYAVEMALALGAGRVDYLDHDPAGAARAEALGATVVEDRSALEDRAYAVTVDAGMDVEVLDAVIRATAPAGTCTVSTMYLARTTPLPLMAMFERALTLRTGQPDIRPTIDPVLELLRAGRIDPRRTTTAVAGWEDAPAAFAAGTGKVVCTRT